MIELSTTNLVKAKFKPGLANTLSIPHMLAIYHTFTAHHMVFDARLRTGGKSVYIEPNQVPVDAVKGIVTGVNPEDILKYIHTWCWSIDMVDIIDETLYE